MDRASLKPPVPASFRPPLQWLLIGFGLAGAATSLAVGLYASEHDPTGKSILGDGLFFTGTLNMKAWLATAFVLLAPASSTGSSRGAWSAEIQPRATGV